MRLTYTCSSCKNQNLIKQKEATRPELQKKIRGDELQVNCPNCGKREKKHLNRITAIADKKILLTGFVLGIISTVVLWRYLGLLAAFTLSLPIMFWRYENEQAHKFNSYAIKRK